MYRIIVHIRRSPTFVFLPETAYIPIWGISAGDILSISRLLLLSYALCIYLSLFLAFPFRSPSFLKVYFQFYFSSFSLLKSFDFFVSWVYNKYRRWNMKQICFSSVALAFDKLLTKSIYFFFITVYSCSTSVSFHTTISVFDLWIFYTV